MPVRGGLTEVRTSEHGTRPLPERSHPPDEGDAAGPAQIKERAVSSIDRIELNVTINGTGMNPWHRFGLRHNPFPQTGKAEYAAGERQLASLDGDPVRTADDIRERLTGFDPEFVEGVIHRWQPGRRVRFKIVFSAGRITAGPGAAGR